MSKTFQINIPISKIDEEQRIVTGIATTEALDSQGDIVDYEASKKAFSEWSGNIREMHNPVAIGKSIDVQFDDKKKQVILSAYISKSTDGENAWQKIQEGILTGYSIGGKIFQITKDKAIEGANRIVYYALSETSLVDSPANPEAKLVMVKSINGNLQRVEAEEDNRNPHEKTWWVQKFMKGNNMQKSVWDAGEAIRIATELSWLIMNEQAEGESDQANDLIEAFNTLREFAAKEVLEGDDYVLERNSVFELATKAINLRKGSKMSDKKVEKSTAVAGGEERNEEAKVVTTAEENGRPVNDTEERAVESGVEVDKGEEVTVKTEGEEQEQPAADEPKEDPKGEEEAPAPKATEDKGKKSDSASDLVKSMETLLTKINDSKEADLKKVADAVSEVSTKVGDSIAKMDALEERLAALEKQPVATKAKASYHVIEKGESEVSADVAELQKRQEHLMHHPEDAKPGEMEAIYTGLRKAQLGQSIKIN